MTLAAELKACFNQTLSIAKPTGKSDFGELAYGAPSTFLARQENRRTVVVNADGDEVVSDYQIYTEQDVDTHDRIWLEGDDDSDATLARLPKRVVREPDVDGSLSHFEVAV